LAAGLAEVVETIFPVDLKCSTPTSRSTKLYSATPAGAVTILAIEHRSTPTISYSFKDEGRQEFDLKFRIPIAGIEATSDEKMLRRFHFVLEQMHLLEKEVCTGSADARAAFFEMLRKNARNLNYEK
jgi:hypothetical protein